MSTFTLHEDPTSGNCYKICLTAAFTNTSIKRKSYSVLKGETRTPEFLRDVSFFGRTPVLQIDHEDGKRTMLAESNAACWYMAEVASTKSSSSSLKLIPDDSLQKAEMLKWMFFEQNKHETSVATLRFWLSHIGRDKLGADRLALVEGKRKQAEEALSNMNEHLDWPNIG